MLWCPAVVKVCARVATPPTRSTGAPIGVLSSRNWTEPPFGTGATVAVSPTADPAVAVAGTVSVAAVAASTGAGPETSTVAAVEVDPVYPAPPL